jgi:hypothetical protein
MRAVSLLLLPLAACALPQTVPSAQSVAYDPMGQIRLYDRSSSFDEVRVRSAKANLSARSDGSWAGTLGDTAVDVSVTDTHVRGANLLLTREESTDERYVVTGQFQGRIVRFELDQEKALIRTPALSVTLAPRTLSSDTSSYGGRQDLKLVGQAALIRPPWPQMALALLAAFD